MVKESLHYGRPKISAILAKVHGITDLLFEGIIEFTLSTIKKQVVSSGKATKAEVESGVRRLLPDETLEFQSDDESDALAVAYTIFERA